MVIAYDTCMDLLYWTSGTILLLVLPLVIFLLVRPTIISKYTGIYFGRPTIAITGFVALAILGSVLSATEPDSVKQERLAQEQATQTAQQQQQEATESRTQEATIQLKSTPPVVVESAVEADARDYWHKIIDIVDGDTIQAEVDGSIESIRIIGIDAPESVNPAECYADESLNFARQLLADGWIQLESDPTQDNRDTYGRLLRYIWFNDNIDFGLSMISTGHAYEYTFRSVYNKQQSYRLAQTTAESEQVGLWSTDTCNGEKIVPAEEPQPSSPAPTTSTAPRSFSAPSTTPTPQPAAPSSGNCDSNYSGGCVPISSTDLNCSDISFSVRVIGTDIHNFDRDKDGYGCESN